MKKSTAIILGIIIIILIGVLGYFLLKPAKKTDAMIFKEEYEALNNTERSNGKLYNNVSIPVDNPIKIVSVSEAIDVLDMDKAILYVGAEWCPWCRNAVPVLFDAAKEENIDTIYYLDLDDDKSVYTVVDGKATLTKEGSVAYYDLLKKLDKELTQYTLEDEKGKEIKVDEKRIYMPDVFAIKNGKVISSHVGTVDLDKNQSAYDPLSDKQKEELKKIYKEMFSSVLNDDTCNEKNCN